MTDFEEFEGGVAVAKAPEEEQAAAAASRLSRLKSLKLRL